MSYIIKDVCTHIRPPYSSRPPKPPVTTYYCSVHGIRFWGIDPQYALRFESKQMANEVITGFKTTHWANTPGTERVFTIEPSIEVKGDFKPAT